MEQSCYKCGHAVPEGAAFCPQCSAPQIRVIVAEPPPPAPTPEGFVAEAAGLPVSKTDPLLALPFHWSHALKPCSLAAMVACSLMVLGLNPFVAMLSVGFLAIVFYRQSRRGISIKTTQAATLGALGGILWFALSSILEALVVIFLHQGPEVRGELMKRIQQAASQTSDPQALAIFEYFKTPGGQEFLMVTGIILVFLAAIVLGSVGGLLGGAILGKRDRG